MQCEIKINIFVGENEDSQIFPQDSDSAKKNIISDKVPIYSTLKKKLKVSTGVGTNTGSMIESSVQTYDFVEVKSDKNRDDNLRSSTGTSPPPQNMSTQVSYKTI